MASVTCGLKTGISSVSSMGLPIPYVYYKLSNPCEPMENSLQAGRNKSHLAYKPERDIVELAPSGSATDQWLISVVVRICSRMWRRISTYQREPLSTGACSRVYRTNRKLLWLGGRGKPAVCQTDSHAGDFGYTPAYYFWSDACVGKYTSLII